MAKSIPMHKVNCRVLQESEDGRMMLDLPRRKDPVILPKSWITLRRRTAKPGDPHSAASVVKYPMAMRIPLDLAKQKGIA